PPPRPGARRVLGDRRAEGRFLLRLAGHDARILERLELTGQELAAVGDAEEVVLGDACVLLRAGGEVLKLDLLPPEIPQDEGVLDVAQEAEMVEGVEAARRARVADDDRQVAVAAARLAPGEVVLGLERLAALVDAEEGDVKAVARVLEVVGGAAEEGDGLLGSEDEADIREPLVAIKMVPPPLIEGDDLGEQAG